MVQFSKVFDYIVRKCKYKCIDDIDKKYGQILLCIYAIRYQYDIVDIADTDVKYRQL